MYARGRTVEDRGERIGLGGNGETKRSRSPLLRKALLVLLAAFLGLLGGCISGVNYGGNYASNLSFLGLRGYEATGWLAGLISGGTLLVIASLSVGTMQNRAALTLTIIGGVLGVLFGVSLFFPIIPASGLFVALVYVASGSIGALVGAIAGRLVFRTRTGKR